MKKAISITLTLMLLLSAGVQSFAMSDTDNTAYETAVNALTKKGYFSGYTDGTFRPERTLSRGEACSMIARLSGATSADMKAAKPAGFSDMGSARWAEPAVNYAVSNGILSGYSDGTFRPTKEVTYAELAVMVVNAMGEKHLVSGAWDEGYMKAAAAQGYFKDAVAFNPSRDGAKPATRGNTAIVMYNAVQARASQTEKDDAKKQTTTMLDSFSGYAYGAINGFSKALNAERETVTEIELVFGNGTQYIQTEKDVTPPMTIQFDGTLYCLRMSDELATAIATKDTVKEKHMNVKKFEEMTSGGYQEVTKKEDKDVLVLGDDKTRKLLELNPSCSVYVATVDGKDASCEERDKVDGYRPGSYRDIRKGDWVRAYDVTKDEDYADVVFVLQK